MIVSCFKGGETLQSIGDRYGITRERVRQIVSRAGVTAKEGGSSKASRDRHAAEIEKREAKFQRVYGCSCAQYASLKAMTHLYKTRELSPIGAFARQRCNARERGVAWKLKLWEWWTIWQESGHWNNRGLGIDLYVMCRKGDVGAYEVGNVYIATSSQNVKDFWRVHGDRHRQKLSEVVAYRRGDRKPKAVTLAKVSLCQGD